MKDYFRDTIAGRGLPVAMAQARPRQGGGPPESQDVRIGGIDRGTVFAALPLLLAFGVLYLSSLDSFQLFHTLAELFSIVVGCGAFMVAWNTRRFSDNHCMLLVGIAYLFVGFLDLMHALAYKGMGVFPWATLDHPTQFWIAARYLSVGALLLAPVFAGRRLRPYLAMAGFAWPPRPWWGPYTRASSPPATRRAWAPRPSRRQASMWSAA